MGISSSGVGKVYLDNVAFMENKGDLLIKDTGPEMLNIGTAGQVLTAAAGGLPTWTTLTPNSFSLVKSVTLAEAAASITADTLDLDTDGTYFIVATLLYNGATDNGGLYLLLNDKKPNTHQLLFNNTALAVSVNSDGKLLAGGGTTSLAVGGSVYMSILLGKSPSGDHPKGIYNMISIRDAEYDAYSASDVTLMGSFNTNLTANVTSITLFCRDPPNNFYKLGIGSKIDVYKMG